MDARRTHLSALGVAAAAIAAVLLPASQPAWSDDVPTAAEAVEKARALEQQGQLAAAEEYLTELASDEDAPLGRNAEVLLEIARLSADAETSRDFAARVIARTRDDELLESAHMLRGDSFFAEARYASAQHEYEAAARHSPTRGPGTADLKRARSILASGDARAAADAYREIAGWGAVPGELTPQAEVGLARSLLVLGQFEEAAEQFERTARIYGESGVRVRALAGAAESHEYAGADSSAVAALQSIVTDYPDSYEAVLAREKLRSHALADSLSAAAAMADSIGFDVEQPESDEE